MPPSLSDLKTYLRITGSQDDARLTVALASGIAQAERDTGRTFSYASNTTQALSTDGQTLVTLYKDVPRTDATRVVTLNGAALTEGTNAWFLPDRRNPDVSVTLQLYHFDRSRGDWYKVDPYWFDRNLDRQSLRGGSPLDLSVFGYVGHPTWPADVTEQVLFLSAWFYWRGKSGASGAIQTPDGETVQIGDEPVSTPRFVQNWRVSPGVAGV